MSDHPLAAVLGEGLKRIVADRRALRKALITEHGTDDAALRPRGDLEERLLITTEHLKRVEKRQYHNGEFETETLAGWNHEFEKMPEALTDVVIGAYPMPVTLAGLYTEERAWYRREDEFLSILFPDGYGPDSALPLAFLARRVAVSKLIKIAAPVSMQDIKIALLMIANDECADPCEMAKKIMVALDRMSL